MKFADGDKNKTFTPANIAKFKALVDKILRQNSHSRLFDGLTETERYAVRYFHYRDVY